MVDLSTLMKEITPAEIADKLELFQYNEYLRLTGQWFIPLPFHYWQFKEGMEFEVDYNEEIMSLTFSGSTLYNMFSAFINEYERQLFYFFRIKRMRIKSFEVVK